jgi:sporulation protein YlmC with PRC-barrel domain
MRASEIIGRRVLDVHDRDIGRVHDIRIERSDDTFRICGLTVGPVAVAQRLGYGRGQMAGPWPLTALFRALASRSLYVPWSDVTALPPGTVRICRSKQELRSVREVDHSGGSDDGRSP